MDRLTYLYLAAILTAAAVAQPVYVSSTWFPQPKLVVFNIHEDPHVANIVNKTDKKNLAAAEPLKNGLRPKEEKPGDDFRKGSMSTVDIAPVKSEYYSQSFSVGNVKAKILKCNYSFVCAIHSLCLLISLF